MTWNEKVPLLSIHGEQACPADVERLASELMDCRHCLSKVKLWCELNGNKHSALYEAVCNVLNGK